MDFYSTFDIARILKIERPRLHEWIRLKFIFPSQASPGPGSKALFSRKDLYGIQLFIELLDFGFNRTDAQHIVDLLMEIRTMRLQKDPVDWEVDYLNISGRYPTKDLRIPFYERFIVGWGAPEVSQYFSRKDTFGKPPYWQLIIPLNEIKEKIDRELG